MSMLLKQVVAVDLDITAVVLTDVLDVIDINVVASDGTELDSVVPPVIVVMVHVPTAMAPTDV